jgi:hypothetical protein
MPPEQNSTPEPVAPPMPVTEPVAPVVAAVPVMPPTSPVATNNSGMGSGTEVPAEIRDKWNWGAFGFNWIWGIGNNTWIALLMFVPVANLVMLILLGVKGNEWAWQNKHWESLEEFKRVQHLWAKVWVILLIVSVILWILIGIFTATILSAVLHSRGY